MRFNAALHRHGDVALASPPFVCLPEQSLFNSHKAIFLHLIHLKEKNRQHWVDHANREQVLKAKNVKISKCPGSVAMLNELGKITK